MHERIGGSYYWGPDGLLIVGVGTNQNILAYTLTLSLCGVLASIPKDISGRIVWLACSAVIGYTLFMTESSTGDLTAIAVLVAGIALWVARRVGSIQPWSIERRRWRLGAAGLLVGACLTAVLGGGLGEKLGSLSGRAPFWRVTWDVAREHNLVFGSGWGAVWAHPWRPAPSNPVVEQIYAESGEVLTHGHNSLVDLLPELGLLGIALALGIYLHVALTAVRRWRIGAEPMHAAGVWSVFALLCLVDLVVFGITEPMSTIPLGWWALILVTEPHTRAHPSG
jgi:O-antigen ligase